MKKIKFCVTEADNECSCKSSNCIATPYAIPVIEVI